MQAFEIGAGGYWTGSVIELDELDEAPSGWTRTAIPTLAAGEWAVWESLGWRITSEAYAPPAPPAPMLAPLSRRRLRLGLLSIGIRAPDIEAVIAAIPDAEAREWAMIEWQDASEYERNHPLIADVAETLHLPAEQVDALWLWAAGL